MFLKTLGSLQNYTASALLTFGAATSGMATTIDNLPGDSPANYFASSGADSAGGTFVSGGTMLDSFTLEIGATEANSYRAIVMSTLGGIPDGNVLWQSTLNATASLVTEVTFTTNLAIAAGASYFIGFDTGIYTSVTNSGGTVEILYTNQDTIAGNYYDNINGGGFELGTGDIAARIEMSTPSAVPLPAGGLLLLTGLGAAAGFRRGRKRTA